MINKKGRRTQRLVAIGKSVGLLGCLLLFSSLMAKSQMIYSAANANQALACYGLRDKLDEVSGSNFELQSTEGKEFFVLPVGTQRLAVYYKNGESALFNLPTDVSVNADKKKYFQEQTDRAETASTMYWHADIASYFAHDKKILANLLVKWTAFRKPRD